MAAEEESEDSSLDSDDSDLMSEMDDADDAWADVPKARRGALIDASVAMHLYRAGQFDAADALVASMVVPSPGAADGDTVAFCAALIWVRASSG